MNLSFLGSRYDSAQVLGPGGTEEEFAFSDDEKEKDFLRQTAGRQKLKEGTAPAKVSMCN
jgi:hypothetical protein